MARAAIMARDDDVFDESFSALSDEKRVELKEWRADVAAAIFDAAERLRSG